MLDNGAYVKLRVKAGMSAMPVHDRPDCRFPRDRRQWTPGRMAVIRPGLAGSSSEGRSTSPAADLALELPEHVRAELVELLEDAERYRRGGTVAEHDPRVRERLGPVRNLGRAVQPQHHARRRPQSSRCI